MTGEVATYIPELARADPRTFGIAVATVDGEVFAIGDAGEPFTIQSISKPLVFGLALEECGRDAVLGRVGVEPSGNPFNSVVVDAASGRPFNPMVNAGAIVTTAMIAGDDAGSRLEDVRAMFGRFAGRNLSIDERVLASERETGDRNRALAWLMRSFGVLEGDAQEIVDLYFAQCSVLVTCRDLAVMGATLANAGVNPVTAERAIGASHVTDVLSVMTTCGMYDHAGEWVFNVGLPAKSGVAGGVLAVLPGQLGIGVFSPALDERGNSVRGIGVCEQLSRDLRLHVFGASPGVGSVVRRIARGDEMSSNRVRSISEDAAIAEGRRGIALFEVQGSLFFSTAEKLYRTIVGTLADVTSAIIDLTRVSDIDEPGLEILDGLVETLTGYGKIVAFVHTFDSGGIGWKLAPSALTFSEVDAALEWCEDHLLDTAGHSRRSHDYVPLRHFDLLEGLGEAELAGIEKVVEVHTRASGTVIFREGDRADAMYFLLSGRVSVLLPIDVRERRRIRRLTTFGAGVVFGEMALLDEGRRSADVVCDERSTVASLSLSALSRLNDGYPTVGKTIYSNLARLLARRLRAANTQIRALAR